MKTCVSIECPFIHYCKDYNFLVDRGNGCSTQREIMEAAEKLKRQRRKEGADNEQDL